MALVTVVSKNGVRDHVLMDPPLPHPLAQQPLTLHPNVLEDLPCRRVAHHVMGGDAIQAEGVEPETDDGRRGFARIPVAPPLPPNPETEFCLKVLCVNVAQPGTADEGRARRETDGEVLGSATRRLLALIPDPGQGVIHLVGMRNSQGGIGDLALAGKALQLDCIVRLEGVEYQTSRAKTGGGAHNGHYEDRVRASSMLWPSSTTDSRKPGRSE
jgi:hypothetical protein